VVTNRPTTKENRMTTNPSTYLAAYTHAIEGFNNDDMETFSKLFADSCEFTSSAGPVGSTRDEIVDAMASARAGGWTTHGPLGTVAGGEFLVAIFENRYADGSSAVSAGIMRFDESGKVSEVRSMETV
jgi:SnoaL-like domain